MYKSNYFPAVIFACLFAFAACQSAGSTQAERPKDTVAMKSDSGIFDHMLVDNLKDPSCGMPVSAGIHDTAHYKENVLGFCSKECKDAFQKSPESMLASAEIKKK